MGNTLLTTSRLKLSHVAPPKCKGDWEMWPVNHQKYKDLGYWSLRHVLTQRTISEKVLSVEMYKGSASFSRWLVTVMADISEHRIPYLSAPWAFGLSVTAIIFAPYRVRASKLLLVKRIIVFFKRELKTGFPHFRETKTRHDYSAYEPVPNTSPQHLPRNSSSGEAAESRHASES